MAERKKDELRGISFPFRSSSTSFPKMSVSTQVIHDSIKALLLTSKEERVMRPDLGVNIHSYVFDNLTPIVRARIALDIKRAIEYYEPRVAVLSVDAVEGRDDHTIVIDVVYRVAGQNIRQQIPVSAASLAG